MLKNITWPEYFILLANLLTAYYLFIGLKFYLTDLRCLLSKKLGTPNKSGHHQFINSKKQSSIESSPFKAFENDVDSENLFETSALKIKEIISQASLKNFKKEEFVFALQMVIKEYSNSQFKSELNALIISECDKHSFIRLSAVELGMLWNEVV